MSLFFLFNLEWTTLSAVQIASRVIPRRNDKEQYLRVTMLSAPKDKGLFSVLEIQILIGFQTGGGVRGSAIIISRKNPVFKGWIS